MKPTGIQIIGEFIKVSSDRLNDREYLENLLVEGIDKSGLHTVKVLSHKFDPVGVTVIAIISESHIAIHTYPEAGHISLDIFTCSPDDQAPWRLFHFLEEKLKPKTKRAVRIVRGNPIYVEQNGFISNFSVNGFEVRYYVKKSLFSKRSQFQRIDIIENDPFGRILFLENEIQISEYDADLYNRKLLEPFLNGAEPPEHVAILGGNNGGLLHHLLKLGVEKITLAEIDPEVIEAVKKYLPGIHRGAFDDPRVEVVIAEPTEFLKQNRGFDALVYDLTTYPEAFVHMEREAYFDQIMRHTRESVKPGGLVSLQCCSELDRETRALFERLLPRYFEDVSFRDAYIPSFCENWIFAAARIPQSVHGETVKIDELKEGGGAYGDG